MIAIADDKSLYLLEFTDRKKLDWEIERLQQKVGMPIVSGHSSPLASIERELQLYFKGSLSKFKTPLALAGTLFQKLVWNELQNIPLGQTRSYKELATAIGNPTAVRAVAQANAANQLAIIIPCHRVIQNCGALGGYAAGPERKKWLLDHEKSMTC